MLRDIYTYFCFPLILAWFFPFLPLLFKNYYKLILLFLLRFPVLRPLSMIKNLLYIFTED